jgi:hypothetical protein
MSAYRLLSDSIVIPGAFKFYQDGIKTHKFTDSPVARDLATAVESFRKANNLARATFQEAYDDVIDYNAQRLGYDPRYFRRNPGAQQSQSFSPPPPTGCVGCGAKLE